MGQPVVCGAFGPGRDLRGSPGELANTLAYVTGLIDMAVELDFKVVGGP